MLTSLWCRYAIKKEEKLFIEKEEERPNGPHSNLRNIHTQDEDAKSVDCAQKRKREKEFIMYAHVR